MMNYILKYLKNEEGQGMAEYGLIITFVALVVVVGITAFGAQLSTFFTNLAGRF